MGLDYTDFKNCPIARYCDFKVLASPYKNQRQDSKQVEVCRHCKRRVEYTFNEKGQLTDDRAYFTDHIRAFAQPTMACYYDINPKATLMFEAEVKDQKRSEELQADLSDKFKFAVKRALNDQDDGITKRK